MDTGCIIFRGVQYQHICELTYLLIKNFLINNRYCDLVGTMFPSERICFSNLGECKCNI